jgi:serine/threonine-protein kinase
MGEYIRKKRLGGGGFGEVWLAHHVALDVDHAVKFVPAASVLNPSKFYDEPQLLKTLEHESIVKVYDAGMDKGELFIAMEVMQGSVDDQLLSGPLKLRRVKPLFCDALKGLQYVHDRGFIHRDIKPANILVDSNLRGKLADFGLAIPTVKAPVATPAGTLTYLAPEILITGETSVQTDIYAMGVSLYEAVNGSAFLPAPANTTDLQNAITAGAFPDRSYYRIYVPRSVKIVINRAMNPDPSKRYRTADELRLALEQTAVKCSWKEQARGADRLWITENNERRITVIVAARTAGWSVEVVQAKKPAMLGRHVRSLEGRYGREREALEQVRKITCGLVSGLALGELA